MKKRTIVTLILAICMMLTGCGQIEKTERNEVTDSFEKLMADWGSHPAAPYAYEGMEYERL